MICQLKIVFDDNKVWIRFLVDRKMTFHQLHQLVQLAFDWDDDLPHCFTMNDIPAEKWKKTVGLSRPELVTHPGVVKIADLGALGAGDRQSSTYFDERQETLDDWLQDGKDSCIYIFGTLIKWTITIVLEEMLSPVVGLSYPACIKAMEDGRRNKEFEDDIRERIAETGGSLSGESFDERMQAAFEKSAKWPKLYSLAAQFYRLQPWTWMSNFDIFAVVDPHSGRVGYCSVLGEGGEVFGLTVYRGDQGLDVLKKLMYGEIGGDDFKYMQDYLLLSYENREDLDDEDYRRIQNSGVKFRGRLAWPCFRNYEPGYTPWSVNEDEVDFMSCVLEQAIAVAEMAKQNPGFLVSQGDDRVWMRYAVRQGEDTLWEGKWTDMTVSKPEQTVYESVLAEIQLAAIRKRAKQTTAVWEIGMFYLPRPVQEGRRPFFPRVSVIMEQNSGLVIGYDLTGAEGSPPLHAHLQINLFQTISNTECYPTRIWVDDEQVYHMLNHVCKQIGIQLKQVDRLPAMDLMKQSMLSSGMI